MNKEYAKRTLVYYFRLLFEANGLNFTPDNQAEIEDIINSICDD